VTVTGLQLGCNLVHGKTYMMEKELQAGSQ